MRGDSDGVENATGTGLKGRVARAGVNAILSLVDDAKGEPRWNVPFDNAALALGLVSLPAFASGTATFARTILEGETLARAVGDGAGLCLVLAVEMAVTIVMLEIAWKLAGRFMAVDEPFVRRSLALPFALMSAGALRFLPAMAVGTGALLMAMATVATLSHAAHKGAALREKSPEAMARAAAAALAPYAMGVACLSLSLGLGGSLEGIRSLHRLPLRFLGFDIP